MKLIVSDWEGVVKILANLEINFVESISICKKAGGDMPATKIWYEVYIERQ